jgi:hypothetical protein
MGTQIKLVCFYFDFPKTCVIIFIFQNMEMHVYLDRAAAQWPLCKGMRETFTSTFFWNVGIQYVTFLYIKIFLKARCWWLMPVILATQEAEIRRIEVQSQTGQTVHKTLS